MTHTEIESIRRLLGETQTEFGQRFGVSLATVARWEQGASEPRGPVLIELLKLDRLRGRR